MTWITKKLGLIVLAVALAAPASVGWAQQRRDQYVYEKLQDIGKHFENTDKNVGDNEKDIQALHAQIEQYKNYAIGFVGCFTLFVGFLKYLGRKEDKSA